MYLSSAADLCGRGRVTFQNYLTLRHHQAQRVCSENRGCIVFSPGAGPGRKQSSHPSDWPSRRHVKVGVQKRGRDGGIGLVWMRSKAEARAGAGWERMWGGNAPASPKPWLARQVSRQVSRPRGLTVSGPALMCPHQGIHCYLPR